MSCRSEGMQKEINCRNCGAPLNARGNCEYCGTKKQASGRSGIEVTATGIKLWADGVLLDDGTGEDDET